MKKQTVVIGGVKYAPVVELPESDTPYCIVRCHDAGVHAGFVEHREGREVTLTHSRRLWRWWGETLSGLAINGSFAPEKCKYAPEVPKIILLDACEIIPCTEAGIKSIRETVGEWENEQNQ